jgi:superfamily I DNA/RNA helicase
LKDIRKTRSARISGSRRITGGSNGGFSRTKSVSSSAPRASPGAERRQQAGVQAIELSDKIEITPGSLSIGAIHLAKGLEFRAVAVTACDDEIIPSQERIENVADHADLEEVYDSERHLLYVACTRARDHLLVTGVKPASEFLGDLVN